MSEEKAYSEFDIKKVSLKPGTIITLQGKEFVVEEGDLSDGYHTFEWYRKEIERLNVELKYAGKLSDAFFEHLAKEDEEGERSGYVDKIFKVYTYYYPPSEDSPRGLVLAYTTYDRPAPHQKIYDVLAKNGTKAKAIAIKLRKEEEKKND